jgi:argininosuccinate lyase
VPFRESHHLVGQVVRRAEELGVSFKALELIEYQAIHPTFGEDVYEVLSFQRSVAARDAQGGTAPAAVRAQIERARSLLAAV